MKLVEMAQAIIEQAEEIDKLGVFAQASAAKALLKDGVTPLLLQIAEKLDNLTTEDEFKRLIEAHEKKVAALERQIKQLLKPAKATA